MGTASITSAVSGQTLTAAFYNTNLNNILNQLNGNMDATNLADAAVTTAKIAAAAVTFVKLSASANYGPWTGAWEFDGVVNFDGAVDFDSTVDFTGATILGATPFVFEGATADAFETSLAIVDPTADRIITFPDEDVNLGQQVVKGWCVWAGATTITDSFNVDTGTGLTENAAGDVTIPWDVDFATANAYGIFGSGFDTATDIALAVLPESATALAVGSARVRTVRPDTAGLLQPELAFCAAIGDR